MTIKVSDWIARFLAEQGVRHVFAVVGGASLHLIDSIGRADGITYICPAHEQGGAMAADAYARVTGGLGCALATSGPGATNLLTGIVSSWFDSVPVLYLTGQVTTFRLKRDTGVRQMGFQETDIVSIARPVTKYATLVEDWRDVRHELEKAVEIARSGRPGPVLVDVPDDIQRMVVDSREFVAYEPGHAREGVRPTAGEQDLARIAASLRSAERPVAILGNGVRLAGAERDALELVERIGLPVLLTWAAADMIPSDHPLVVGTFGTHGTRHANFALQNADCILSIGARLDTREAGSPYADFGRGAAKHVVDLDPAELGKLETFGMEVDTLVHADAGAFISELGVQMGGVSLQVEAWRRRIADWRVRYPVCAPPYRLEHGVNPYVFMEALSDWSEPGALIACDTGCALAWTCQGFTFKANQRLLHAFNTTPMGYALPAAVGASFARDGAPVTCIAGDGSLMMNLQELATVARHRLPVRIFLIDNNGYAMVQQTQEQWLDGRYSATTPESGLGFPDWERCTRAFGLDYLEITTNAGIADGLAALRRIRGPVLCRVDVASSHRVIPQVRFGFPLEDGEPMLPREAFLANMIVQPTAASSAHVAEGVAP